jgi:hypothetical protein
MSALEPPAGWSTCERWAAQFRGRTLEIQKSARFGKAATRRAKELGIELTKVPDPRFGSVNSYPNSLLAEVWAKHFEKRAAR